MANWQTIMQTAGGLGTDIGEARIADRANKLAELQVQHGFNMDAEAVRRNREALELQRNAQVTNQRWLEAQGWRTVGQPVRSLDPVTKNAVWLQKYHNLVTNETKDFPLPGIPEGTFEARLAEMEKLRDIKIKNEQGVEYPLFTPDEAARTAFNIKGADPLGELESIIQRAHALAKSNPEFAAKMNKEGGPFQWGYNRWLEVFGRGPGITVTHPETQRRKASPSQGLTAEALRMFDLLGGRRLERIINTLETELARGESFMRPEMAESLRLQIANLTIQMNSIREKAKSMVAPTQPGTSNLSVLPNPKWDNLGGTNLSDAEANSIPDGMAKQFSDGRVFIRKGSVVFRVR